jgi:acyl-CoA synthetase (AMP-forming)/AMP-acid ligase II
MEISLGEAITMTARNKPDAPSFVFADGGAHTFARTNARVNRLASALRAEGVRRGDRLAVLAGLAPLRGDRAGPSSRRYRDSRRTCRALRAAAGPYKVPADFRFTDAPPVNASGKILKRELRTRD